MAKLLGLLLEQRRKTFDSKYDLLKAWARRLASARALTMEILTQARLEARGARIGRLVHLRGARLIGPASRLAVGDTSFLGRCAIALHDTVSIGRNVVVSDDAKLLTGTHDLNDKDWPLFTAPIVIEDFAWVAESAMVLPGVRVGRAAVVAAGSVVTRSIGPNEIFAGNPARLVGVRKQTEFAYAPSLRATAFSAWVS